MKLAFSQAKAALIFLALLSALLAWIYPLLVLVPLVLLAFIFFFYRDPLRQVPVDERIVLAPADGTVTRIAPTDCAYVGDASWQVSIFMSPFSVHVNRSPIAGVVEAVTHQPGKFLPAMNPDAPLLNEKRSYCIRGAIKVKVIQVAGIMARRTVNWVFQDQEVAQGEKIGMIKLGSCTQVTFPANYKVLVAEGDKVQAGLTVIGRVD